MKIRKAFVANSSSSSFICEICGEGDVYHDSIDIRDIGMVYCVNEHLICDEHLLASYNEEDDNEDGYVPESACPICQFKCYSTPEIVPYLLETRGIPKEEVFAKVKEANKRRKKLYDVEYINYVFDKFNLNEKLLLEELKSKFSKYENFKNRK